MVAPVVIVGTVLAYLGRPDEAVPGAAGAVDPVVASCVRSLKREGDDVVVIGNSKTGTDIDRAALSRALGVKGIGTVGRPGSGAPLWHAALERCAYEEGRRPKLVVVYATAGAMLRTTLESELERLAIAPFLGESEPVLERKVFGGERASPFWQRVGTRKTEAVLGLQHGVRDTVAGLFFAPAGAAGAEAGGLLADGRAYAEPALEAVLGADAAEDTRHRAIPIAESGTSAGPAGEPSVADTLVPDLVALARANGARVVFVRAPVADSRVATYDLVDPELLRQMVVALNEGGAAYVDLTGLGLPATAYGDGVHMSPAGRTLLTAALATRLAELDALGTRPFAPAPVPRAPAKFARIGAPPALPTPTAPTRGPWDCGWQLTVRSLAGVSDPALERLGVGSVSPLALYEDGAPLSPHANRDAFDLSCAGAFSHQGPIVKFSPTGGPADVVPTRAYTLGLSEDFPLRNTAGAEVWWVYPGTTLRAEVVEGWEGPGEGFAVRVEAVVALPGAAPATLAWDGGVGPLRGDGTAAAVTVAGEAPRGPWGVEVRSPPDGPWLLVRRMVAGTGAEPWHLLGSVDTGTTVDFLKGKAIFPAEVPHVGPLGPISPTADGGWRFDTSALGVPDSEVINARSGLNRCSPARVSEDGVPLAAPNIGLGKLAETDGAYAHTAAGILFNTSDRSAPTTNGRAYTAALDPGRMCATSRWLYPGDVTRFRVGPRQLWALATGATHLRLSAVSFDGGSPAAALTARLFVGGEAVFTTTLPLAGIDAAPADHALPAPVGRDSEDVFVELSVPPDAPFTLVSALALMQPPRPAFPADPPAFDEPAADPPLADDAPRGVGEGAAGLPER